MPKLTGELVTYIPHDIHKATHALAFVQIIYTINFSSNLNKMM